MEYKSSINPAFGDKSYCHMCFTKKNKNAILYEVNMTGYERALKEYKIDRQGYYTYLINFTLSGGGTVQYKGKEYNLAPGDLIFINCNDRHICTAKETGWEFLYIHVTGLGVQYLYDSFVNITGNVFHNFDKKVLVRELRKLHRLIDILPKQITENSYFMNFDDESVCCDVSLCAYNILVDIDRQISALHTEIPYALSESLEFIKKNYNRRITLGEIADSACLSKYHFERLFAKYMKISVYQYISELRFERARWLLESTKMKLIDVALEVGYSDIQALNKLFKKNLGVTPSEYRKDKFHYYVIE